MLYDITTLRGNRLLIPIEFKESIENYTFTFFAKSNTSLSNSDAVLSKTFPVGTGTDAQSGKYTVLLTGTDMQISKGVYDYQLDYVDTSGTGPQTLLMGKLTVNPSVKHP